MPRPTPGVTLAPRTFKVFTFSTVLRHRGMSDLPVLSELVLAQARRLYASAELTLLFRQAKHATRSALTSRLFWRLASALAPDLGPPSAHGSEPWTVPRIAGTALPDPDRERSSPDGDGVAAQPGPGDSVATEWPSPRDGDGRSSVA